MENILFSSLNVSKEVLKAIAEMGFEEATPIQSQSIMPIIQGEDIVAQAPTGTGKTCAFGIPLIENVDITSDSVTSLVLCPTRELVIQTTEELLKLSKFKKGVKIVPIYGGQQIDRQIIALKKRPQIIVATPGRLMDHMRRHTIKLQDLKYIVLDEADEMLNMGFREDIDTILESVPEERQMVLFSATLSQDIMNITKKYQRNPKTIKITRKEITVPTIEQYYIEVKSNRKIDILTRLIDAKDFKLSMVFCNTKRMVDELTEALVARGYLADSIHGDMKQSQRDKVMAKFRSGKVDILVATDVAARGIDIDNIEAVFNFDIPSDEEYYVHRIGRTGRANKKGVSYTFTNSRQMWKLRDIMKYTKSAIVPYKIPKLSDIEEIKMRKVFEDVEAIIKKGEHERFVTMIEKYIEDDEVCITTLDIAAALLSKNAGFASKDTINEDVMFESPDNSRRRREDSADTVRLFLNIGTLDKINKRNMLDLFKGNTNLDIRLLKEIDILDKYSFVNVPDESVEDILTSLNGIDFKGRKVSVEVASKKPGKKRRR